MRHGRQSIRIPNPHRGDISVDLLAESLRQAGISRDEWDALSPAPADSLLPVWLDAPVRWPQNGPETRPKASEKDHKAVMLAGL